MLHDAFEREIPIFQFITEKLLFRIRADDVSRATFIIYCFDIAAAAIEKDIIEPR